MLNPSFDRHQDKAHPALLQLIKQEADRNGALSFARFMELALYAPEVGYYERSENVVGRAGDFYTSVSVGPLFGELLACQFAEWMKKSAWNRPVVIECGAHNGRLAADILHHLRTAHPILFQRLEYWILEASPIRKAWQQRQLAELSGQVHWFHSWTDLSSFRDNHDHPVQGVIFSNELLDALPFHRLAWRSSAHQWIELGVKHLDNSLKELDTPLGSEVLEYARWLEQSPELLWPNLPQPLLDLLPDGFQIEISPAAAQWWRHAATVLQEGWLVAFDYGLTAPELLSPERSGGTTRGYARHRRVKNLLANPGTHDITASVNFSVLQWLGESLGLDSQPLVSQSQFLTQRLDAFAHCQKSTLSPQQIREFQTLTHPDQLGRAFRVLIQSRGISVGG